MQTQAKNAQHTGRTLSTDELAQVSGGAAVAQAASAIVMHNPPGYLMHNPPGYLTHNPPGDLAGRVGLAVPPDPY